VRRAAFFLSDKARGAYFQCWKLSQQLPDEGSEEDRLSEEDIKRLWRAGQELCRRLAADIGAAEDPQLAGRLPAKSPDPTARMKDRKDSEPTNLQ
jgi:hypothetical protein